MARALKGIIPHAGIKEKASFRTKFHHFYFTRNIVSCKLESFMVSIRILIGLLIFAAKNYGNLRFWRCYVKEKARFGVLENNAGYYINNRHEGRRG